MKFIVAALSLAIAASLCSCGSLDRDISSDGLSKEDMVYIDNAASDNGSASLQGYGKAKISGAKSSSVCYPAFPWIQFECFFKDDAGNGYGLLSIYSFMPVLPVFVGANGVLYDREGLRKNGFHVSGVPLLYSYASLSRRDFRVPGDRDVHWQFNLVDLPWLDGFIGFGNGYFQALWIPFVSQDPDADPVKNISLDYTPGEDFSR